MTYANAYSVPRRSPCVMGFSSGPAMLYRVVCASVQGYTRVSRWRSEAVSSKERSYVQIQEVTVMPLLLELSRKIITRRARPCVTVKHAVDLTSDGKRVRAWQRESWSSEGRETARASRIRALDRQESA